MCNPIGLITGGLGAIGSMRSARSAQADALASADQALFDADIARGNARLGRLAARTERTLAELPRIAAGVEERRIRGEVAATTGAQTAIFAALGIDPAAGAPLLLQGMTVAQGETDIALTRAGAAAERAGLLAGAASTDATAASSRLQEEAARWRAARLTGRGRELAVAGMFGAATSFLGGYSAGSSFAASLGPRVSASTGMY